MERTTPNNLKGTTMATTTRWMVHCDIEACAEISYRTHELAWLAEDFQHSMRQRNELGLVVEEGTDIIGFVVYRLESDGDAKFVRVLKLAATTLEAREAINTKLAERAAKLGRRILV